MCKKFICVYKTHSFIGMFHKYLSNFIYVLQMNICYIKLIKYDKIIFHFYNLNTFWV